jgi:hypothetical protein
MSRSAGTTALAGIAALALVVSTVGPCHCLADAAACHCRAPEASAHSCCEKPTAVQATVQCCCGGADLALATLDSHEIAPPLLETRALEPGSSPERWVPRNPIRTPPLLSPERTTVLLI